MTTAAVSLAVMSILAITQGISITKTPGQSRDLRTDTVSHFLKQTGLKTNTVSHFLKHAGRSLDLRSDTVSHFLKKAGFRTDTVSDFLKEAGRSLDLRTDTVTHILKQAGRTLDQRTDTVSDFLKQASRTLDLRTDTVSDFLMHAGRLAERQSFIFSFLNLRSCSGLKPKCSCKDTDEIRPRVECTNIESVAELTQAFGTRNSPYSIISLHNSTLSKLPGNTFGSARFNIYDLRFNKIEEIADDLFNKSREKTTYIHLGFNKLKSFPYQGLNAFDHLQGLVLSHNEMEAIPERAFPVLQNLRSFSIDNNHISEIGPHAFSSLTSLRTMDLYSNKLTEIKPFAFHMPNLRQPIFLNLVHNAISRIHPGAFQLPAGSRVIMSYNNITTMPEEDWKSNLDMFVGNGGYVDLTGNPIVCDDSVAWITGNPKYRHRVKGTECKPTTYRI